MSGFFGIVGPDGSAIDPGLLERVAGKIRFRGSDGVTTWTQGAVGTGFAYLESGPARQAARQPVTLEANWLLGDIRIDARRELIDQLRRNGEPPSEDPTSEELILRAWRIWGESSLQHVIGDFSFALWDQNSRALWCVRDFVGARPFYYGQSHGIFCFSNTLEAVRSVREISSALDENFVGEFLLDGACWDRTRTVYADIRKLPSGHLLEYKDQTASVRPFLTLPIEEVLRFSRPEEYLEAYRCLLQEAVKDRLPRDATALYLSGGLDSASVCAIATEMASQRGQREQLKAFTVGWRPLFEDPEPHFAALSANFLGLEHQLLEDQGAVPFAPPRKPEDRPPEPTCEAFFSCAQERYRKIARYSHVILSGDGGDDVLMGQSWPYLRHLWSSGEWSEIAQTLGSFIWAHGSLPPLRAGFRAKLRRLSPNEWEGYPDWFNPEFEKRCGLREKWKEKQLPTGGDHPTHPIAYASLHKGYWSNVLESEDAGNCHVALETRAPLLDLRLLRFLLRVPPVPWCANKELVRRSMRGYLPEAVLRREKTPLLRDPLEVFLKEGRWTPDIPDTAPARIHHFLNWEKWKATLKYTKGYTSTTNLFPMALVDWVKDVENARGIE